MDKELAQLKPTYKETKVTILDYDEDVIFINVYYEY